MSTSPPSGTPGPFVDAKRRRRPRTGGAIRPRTGGAMWRSAGRRLLLVTGGSGFVGRHLVRVVGRGWSIVAPSSASMNLLRPEVVTRTIADWRPAAVIHLAYRKDDPRVIVDGTRHVAEASRSVGARLVHLSTDVVFGGGPLPFGEHDEPTPVTDYGRDKLAAEQIVAEVDPAAVIVRTSLIYGTELLSPPQESLRTELAGPARRTSTSYFTDEFRCPVHADDLSRALVALASMPTVSGPLHVAGTAVVSRHDLAVRFAHHLGLGRRVGAIARSSIAESGQTRAGRIELDVGAAVSIGLECRSVTDVLPAPR